MTRETMTMPTKCGRKKKQQWARDASRGSRQGWRRQLIARRWARLAGSGARGSQPVWFQARRPGAPPPAPGGSKAKLPPRQQAQWPAASLRNSSQGRAPTRHASITACALPLLWPARRERGLRAGRSPRAARGSRHARAPPVQAQSAGPGTGPERAGLLPVAPALPPKSRRACRQRSDQLLTPLPQGAGRFAPSPPSAASPRTHSSGPPPLPLTEVEQGALRAAWAALRGRRRRACAETSLHPNAARQQRCGARTH